MPSAFPLGAWQLAGCFPLEPSAAIQRAALVRPAAGLGRSARPLLGRLLRWASFPAILGNRGRPSTVSLHQLDESAGLGRFSLRSAFSGFIAVLENCPLMDRTKKSFGCRAMTVLRSVALSMMRGRSACLSRPSSAAAFSTGSHKFL